MQKVIICLCVASTVLLSNTSSSADPVTFNYSAQVATVTGSPIFGVNITIGDTVTGFFTYESSTPDSNASNDRGDYLHISGGAFRASVVGLNTVITGSTTPFVQVENLSSDTFRYIDGAHPANQVNPDGVMMLNGVPDADIELFLAISDSSGSVFVDDSLPNPFPISMPPNIPHTFSLNDGNATILLQFTSLTPVPEPSTMAILSIGFVAVMATRRRRCIL